MRKMNAVSFGYAVLKKEGLHDWKIELTDGNEGFCDKQSKTIFFGRNVINNKKLMLHEISHCLTDAFHYSKGFENIVDRLEKGYLLT